MPYNAIVGSPGSKNEPPQPLKSIIKTLSEMGQVTKEVAKGMEETIEQLMRNTTQSVKDHNEDVLLEKTAEVLSEQVHVVQRIVNAALEGDEQARRDIINMLQKVGKSAEKEMASASRLSMLRTIFIPLQISIQISDLFQLGRPSTILN